MRLIVVVVAALVDVALSMVVVGGGRSGTPLGYFGQTRQMKLGGSLYYNRDDQSFTVYGFRSGSGCDSKDVAFVLELVPSYGNIEWIDRLERRSGNMQPDAVQLNPGRPLQGGKYLMKAVCSMRDYRSEVLAELRFQLFD